VGFITIKHTIQSNQMIPVTPIRALHELRVGVPNGRPIGMEAKLILFLQLQEKILLKCGGRQLAALKTASQYFLQTSLVEAAARAQLAEYRCTGNYTPG